MGLHILSAVDDPRLTGIDTGIIEAISLIGTNQHIVEAITVNYVLRALDGLGTDNIPVERSEELERIQDTLREFSTLVENSEANRLLRDL